VEHVRPEVSAPAFWEALYRAGEDAWELGGAAPPLAAWLEAGGRFAAAERGRRARVVVPGCGRGHDARLLARLGHEVTGVDFVPATVAEARALAEREGLDVRYEERDVFDLGRAHPGAFDGVWEYTCFCAIDPARRAEYVDGLRAVLRPGGLLLACFYPMRDGRGGPPFPVSQEEIPRLLTPGFRLRSVGPPDRSAERRRGLEWLVLAERRG
jgi:SAM-dependent methyltransferase